MLGVRKVAARKSREKCEGEMRRAAKEIGEWKKNNVLRFFYVL
jgi:hypothetical protein